MKQLASADFRKRYTSQAETCEVTAHGKVIGTWIPFGQTSPLLEQVVAAADGAVETGPEPEAPTRMTIRPVKGTPKVVVGTPQRIIDPLVAAQRERSMYSQLASRLYGPRKQSKD